MLFFFFYFVIWTLHFFGGITLGEIVLWDGFVMVLIFIG